MTSPTVSIILPTLNDDDYISKAIESIISQTYDDFEIVIVDDESTDGTIEYLTNHPDSRINLIVRKDENGITSAINYGIQQSQGELIARHDADDWSDIERLKKQVTYFNENDEIALVGTGAHLVNENGNVQSRRRVLNCVSLDDLIKHNEFVHGSVMMRKEALESVGGYDEWFPTTEDYDLWLRLADKYEVRNIDEPLYYFRQHDESLYGSNLEEIKLYHLLAVRKVQSGLNKELKRRIDEHGIKTFYEMLSTDERRWFHSELAKENLRYGNLKQGRQHAKRLLAVDRTNPLAYALFVLSYTTPTVTKLAARTFRRLINARIGFRNWRS